jgi:hypothetical protein
MTKTQATEATELPARYVCKKCGAESPAGIGYVVHSAEGNHELSMNPITPDPDCPNPHLLDPDRPIDRKARLADARTLAGYRSAHFARETGTLVLVLDAEPAMLDPDGGRWYTVCDDHSQAVGHRTLSLAKYHAANPLGWCEVCNGADPEADPALLDDEPEYEGHVCAWYYRTLPGGGAEVACTCNVTPAVEPGWHGPHPTDDAAVSAMREAHDAFPTAECPVCGLDRRVIEGTLSRHGTFGYTCAGSGTEIAQ